MNRIFYMMTLAAMLSGCTIAFPLLGDTSNDVDHMEFMQSLKTKQDVLAAFHLPDTTQEYPAGDVVLATWAYAAPPNGNYLGYTPFDTPELRRYRPGDDPTYEPPTIEELQGADFDLRGGLVVEFDGDSVTCWKSHNLDFSSNKQRNHLTFCGFLVDLVLMYLTGAVL